MYLKDTFSYGMTHSTQMLFWNSFFLFFPENSVFHFMQIVSFAWNAKPYFLEKIRKYHQFFVCWISWEIDKDNISKVQKSVGR